MEQFIYQLVKDRPWLKDSLKLVYQGLFSILGRQRESLPQDWVLRDRCFFGFHDKSPWSSDGKWLLGHRFIGIGNEPDGNHRPVEIVVFGGRDWRNPIAVASTRAWNWQQGSQLQWLGDSHRVIFNDFVDGVCKCVEVDLGGRVQRVYSYPIAASSPDGEIFAAICFRTFGDAMSPYGYAFSKNGADSNVPPDTLILFKAPDSELARVVGRQLPAENDEMPGETNFVSHVIFSPDSKRVAFMRRRAIPGRRVKSALFVYDIATGGVVRAPFATMVSHYCWLDEKRILAFANSPSADDGFFTWNANTGKLHAISDVLGYKDGHPHASTHSDSIVIDTYPDRTRIQHLRLWRVESESVQTLAKLYSPLKFWGDQRVDLHPRVRSDGAFACVDCSRTGVRSLATLALDR